MNEATRQGLMARGAVEDMQALALGLTWEQREQVMGIIEVATQLPWLLDSLWDALYEFQ